MPEKTLSPPCPLRGTDVRAKKAQRRGVDTPVSGIIAKAIVAPRLLKTQPLHLSARRVSQPLCRAEKNAGCQASSPPCEVTGDKNQNPISACLSNINNPICPRR